ncbi:polysaccharide pyruvyl transferase family protein [Parapedobacter sp. DT-150]|uniref:polysaccharide pyruvyl transferase family protein n=1 Tax=Parapedobacter sp. DT-150 TaxID=3396162 RepID=UPI003F194CA0
MKKIGVATLGNAKENYGQLLQAYALQTFLRKSGYDAFLIQYKRAFTLQDEKGLRKIAKAIYLFFRKLSPSKADNVKTTNLSVERRDFENFYKEHFEFSEELYTTIEQLEKRPPTADVYIAGSDQIWNWGGRYGYDKVYFLQFGENNIKRISYAAGMSKIPDDPRLVKELEIYLKRFNSVSLREPTGIPLLKQAGCLNPQVVLDPTLLLEKEDYTKLTESIPPPSKEYILGYLINFNTVEDIAWPQIETYLSETDIDFKYVSSEGYEGAVNKLGIYENHYYTTPEWIAAIQHAIFVLTSSYHGLLFSIIMEKPFLFFFIDNQHSYGRNRALHILKELELESRVYQKNDSLTFKEQLHDPIDWNRVRNKLEKLKKSSVDFLISAIEN